MNSCRRLWLSMNDRTMFSTYDETERTRLDLAVVQEYFDSWKKEIEDGIKAQESEAGRRLSKAAMKKLRAERFLRFISSECYEDLILICKGVPQFIHYVFHNLNGVAVNFCPKLISQDLLENDFSQLRGSAGGGANPTLYCAAYCLRTLNLNALNSL